jgi:hypothetical protein
LLLIGLGYSNKEIASSVPERIIIFTGILKRGKNGRDEEEGVKEAEGQKNK